MISGLELSAESLQLIVGAYGSATPHQGPATSGFAARNDYLAGITPAFRQQRIEEIVRTSAGDLRSFAPLLNSCRPAAIGRPSAAARKSNRTQAELWSPTGSSARLGVDSRSTTWP